MVLTELLPYQCIICNRTFLDYVDKNTKEEHFKPYIQYMKDGMELEKYELKDYDYLHPIKNERKCKKCRSHVDLANFGLHT